MVILLRWSGCLNEYNNYLCNSIDGCVYVVYASSGMATIKGASCTANLPGNK